MDGSDPLTLLRQKIIRLTLHMANFPICIGLIGVGHLGKIHAKCIAALPDLLKVVGVYDVDFASAKTVGELYGWRVCETLEQLFEEADAVDIVTPTVTHAVLAKAALEANCHVFIEKPVTATVEEAVSLEVLAKARNLIVQVGHVERFNPAFRVLETAELKPVFIEAHRLAQFNPRSTDVSVVLDLMIHDLDLVLSLMPTEVEHVSASGVGVVGDSVDIANARLDFADGSTANLTASRISLKNMRKLRLFQRDAYIGIDLLEKETEIVRLSDHDPESPGMLQLPTENGLREIIFDRPTVPPANAIEDELREFAECIQAGKPVTVGISEGRKALALAQRIIEDIDKRRARLLAHNALSQSAQS